LGTGENEWMEMKIILKMISNFRHSPEGCAESGNRKREGFLAFKFR
jgi:hypothetical protein